MTDRIVVQKYGGSSVKSTGHLKRVAQHVVRRKREGFSVVVVVSAMGDATDALLRRAKEIAEQPDRRELDMLLSVGERISMSLLAMAIREAGEEAISLTGSQSGIITTHSHTNARIMEVRPFRVQDELAAGRIVIVAGYQGVSYKRDVTTLGRGGSDTTAVALAAALDAVACEIYSDVAGVYSADPRIVPDAIRLAAIGYDEMQALAHAGAKVLNPQAVAFAKSRGIALYARKTGSVEEGTVIRIDAPGAPSGVRGVAHDVDVLWLTGEGADAFPRMLSLMKRTGVPPRSLGAGPFGAFGLVVGADLHHRRTFVRDAERALGTAPVEAASVSIVGEGVTGDPARIEASDQRLKQAEVDVLGRLLAPLTATWVVTNRAAAERATRALHPLVVDGSPRSGAPVPAPAEDREPAEQGEGPA